MGIDKINGALAGKILRVNLSDGNIWTEDTEEYAKKYIGGLGINSYILLNELDPQTRWSDPDNMLLFGVGALVGTFAPSACKISLDSKNVFSGGKGSANFGAHFGAELKYAGFDHVIITGKAEKPVYLWICDGQAEIRDASRIWGKTTYETERILQEEELCDKRVRVASIGPAGENLVKGSCIIADCGSAAAGSGVGCVMGSKNLKALAARGHGAIKVARPKEFFEAVDVVLEKVSITPFAKLWRKGVVYDILPDSWLWETGSPCRNGQDEFWDMEKRHSLTNEETGVPSFKKKVMACVGCPIGCKVFYKIDDGKYDMEGPSYWVNSAKYSVRFDMDNGAASLRYFLMTNNLGLDGDFCTVVSTWAFECYQRGLLTKEDCDGLELNWGDPDAMLELQRKIAYREGIGDFLADGVYECSKTLGKGSEKFAIHMKKQDTYDAYRTSPGWGLGLTTSPVAGRHLRGAVGRPVMPDPEDPTFNPRDYEKKPEVVFWQLRAKQVEDLIGVADSLPFKFFWDKAFDIKDLVTLTNSALGIDLTEEEYMLIGQRAYNLEKAFNTLHTDLDRKDDYPPTRYVEEAIKTGRFAGARCDREKWDEMLDRFYELNGWDKKTSLQTRKGLMELGMEDVASKLEKAGKLID